MSSKKLDGRAVASLVVACVGVAVFVLLPLLCLTPGPFPKSALIVAIFALPPAPLIALSLGRSSCVRLKEKTDSLRGRGIAIIGIVLSVLQLCMVAILVLSAFVYIGINWQ